MEPAVDEGVDKKASGKSDESALNPQQLGADDEPEPEAIDLNKVDLDASVLLPGSKGVDGDADVDMEDALGEGGLMGA